MSSVYEALQRARQGDHGRGPRAAAPLRRTPAFEGARAFPRGAAWSPVTLAPGPFAAELGPLLAAVRPLLDGDGAAVLHVVAATPGEGASTIARELALLAATGGQRRTLLIDADRRNPRTAKSFDCDTGRGLVESSWDDDGAGAAEAVAGTLLSVACLVGERAPHRPDPANAADLYRRLRARFDLIVVDCPSVAGGDYLDLAPDAADGVILVIRAETTRPAVVSHAKGQIEQAGGTLLGAVLNRRSNYIPAFLYRML